MLRAVLILGCGRQVQHGVGRRVLAPLACKILTRIGTRVCFVGGACFTYEVGAGCAPRQRLRPRGDYFSRVAIRAISR
jgi:hypothetical protein